MLDRYKLEPFENGASILSCQFSEDTEHYYVVGTAFAYPNENEPTKGRILVFKVIDGVPQTLYNHMLTHTLSHSLFTHYYTIYIISFQKAK